MQCYGCNSIVLSNCVFNGNSADWYGGGVEFSHSISTLTNCILSRNWANLRYGGGICAVNGSAVTLVNCTCVVNSAPTGNAVACDNLHPTYPPNYVQIVSCILWDVRNEICNNDNSTIMIRYSDVQDGWPGTDNIDADPRFVSGPLGDYYLSQKNAGQWWDSPCVDAGSDTASNLGLDQLTTRTDEVGDQGTVDMGYHYPKSPPRALTVDRNTEDFETADLSRFNWSFSGDANWTITLAEKYSRNYSAKAGPIGDDEYTTLEITRDCVAGDISFYRKVSSEIGFDYLRFYIDGIEKGKWSAYQNWQKVSFPVKGGIHTFTWTYSKDGSEFRGSDTAWIDDIVFPIP